MELATSETVKRARPFRARVRLALAAAGVVVLGVLAVGKVADDSNVTDDGSYRFIPYGGVVEEEQTFGGYTIPTSTRGGRWYGTDQYLDVLHLKVDSVRFV